MPLYDWNAMVIFLHDESDMTFQEIGNRVGLKRNSVFDLYYGNTKQPGFEVCNKLKRLFNIKSRN